ncbi:MAG: type II secretion system protein N, partial [Acidiferrobacterales bacterium]
MEHVISQLALHGQQLLHKTWFIRAINGAALLFLTATMAQWTWTLVSPPQSSTAIAISGSPIAASVSYNLDQLLATELFGRADKVTAQALEEIPISSLNLVLTGIVAANQDSLALISVDGKEQMPFAIGEEVINGAVLDAIYPDRAIIIRHGIRESLLLRESTPALPTSAFLPSSRKPSQTPVKHMGGNDYQLSRDAITRQLQNPKFLSQALIVPAAGGGFVVRNIQSGSLYEQIGLKKGDVIKKVNGKSINTM